MHGTNNTGCRLAAWQDDLANGLNKNLFANGIRDGLNCYDGLAEVEFGIAQYFDHRNMHIRGLFRQSVSVHASDLRSRQQNTAILLPIEPLI